VNVRELGTILAALRFYQLQVYGSDCSEAADLEDAQTIACDDGTIDPLTASEIDALCERLNEGEVTP
jgi:hypothetical protein